MFGRMIAIATIASCLYAMAGAYDRRNFEILALEIYGELENDDSSHGEVAHYYEEMCWTKKLPPVTCAAYDVASGW